MKEDSIITQSPEDTLNLARTLAMSLKDSDTIICLDGPLGAGKSLFCKGLISTLTDTAEDTVQSPTFNYLNIYPSHRDICHFDLYRLENSQDFLNLGFDDYFANSHLCLIEWPSRILNILPKNVTWVNFSILDLNTRSITISRGQL